MNILSLFDGMSCGRISLERIGIKVDNYYSSEIDKYAMQVTQKNYPDTIQLGDIRKVKGDNLPNIDLLLAGSPCQGFSFAGKQLNFEDPRSKLFFEFVRILNEIKETNPDVYWLLENVQMKKEYKDVISNVLGCRPVMINSALVSAQNRKRLYWTNIPRTGQGLFGPEIEQPEDKGILLKDILEDVGIGMIKNHGKYEARNMKSMCLDANYYKGTDNHGARTCIQVGLATDIKGRDILRRIYSPHGKSPAITTVCGGHQEKKIAITDIHYRKLTPLECERLQTVPENYTEGISNTQRYKMLGNGWTIDVIVHLLKGIINNQQKKQYK